MIGYLEGTVLEVLERQILLKSRDGIGWQIFCALEVKKEENIQLYITQVFRENSQDLFGFHELDEKILFEQLLKVKGVGPKSAFTLLNSLGRDNLVEAILTENKKMLTKAPGVGPRVAGQIILDLSSKISEIKKSERVTSYRSSSEGQSKKITHSHSIFEESIMACVELGFNEKTIAPLVRDFIKKHGPRRAEDVVSHVLKEV